MPIKLKILCMTTALLVLSSATVFLINRDAFISDKNAYIYTTLMDRMQFESSRVRSEVSLSIEKVKNGLLMIDPDSGQFNNNLRSNMSKDNWGRIVLFKQLTELQQVDAVGISREVLPQDGQILKQLRERQVFTQYDLKTRTLKTYFKQHPYAILAESMAPTLSTLLNDGISGAKNTYSQVTVGPSLYPNLDLSFVDSFKGQRSIVKELQVSEQPYFIAYTEVPEISLSLFQVLDKNSIFAVIKRTMNSTLFVSLAIVLFGVIISIVSVNSLTKGILQLSNRMTLFASNGDSTPLKAASSDEIGKMTRVFNSMMSKISDLLVQTAQKARMESELATAKEVQETLLPENKYEDESLMLKGFYLPASECGGDLWYHHSTQDKFFLFMGDATGHGVPAALITSAARTILAVCMDENIWSPSRVLSMMNKALCTVAKGEKMMTAMALVYDRNTKTLTYSNASHDPAFIVPLIEDRKIKKTDLRFLLGVNSKRLGHNPEEEYQEESITLDPKELLFIYTDGLIDATNKDGEVFGERTLLKIATDMGSKKNHKNLIDTLEKQVKEYTDHVEQPDDITFAGLFIK